METPLHSDRFRALYYLDVKVRNLYWNNWTELVHRLQGQPRKLASTANLHQTRRTMTQHSTDEISRRRSQYWRRNIQYLLVLLSVWFVSSYLTGIVFVDILNQFRIPKTGFPLGFWFAQQGSIYIFVILIFIYVFLMNNLDQEFGVEEIDE